MTTPSTRPEYRRPDGVSTARAHPLRRAQVHCFMMRYLKAGHADRQHGLARLLRRGAHAPVSTRAQVPALDGRRVRRLRRAQNPSRNAWSPTLLHYAQYAESDLHARLKDMHGVLHSTKGWLAAVKKMPSGRRGTVATMPLKVLTEPATPLCVLVPPHDYDPNNNPNLGPARRRRCRAVVSRAAAAFEVASCYEPTGSRRPRRAPRSVGAP